LTLFLVLGAGDALVMVSRRDRQTFVLDVAFTVPELIVDAGFPLTFG
jgi:hypothetical protein